MSYPPSAYPPAPYGAGPGQPAGPLRGRVPRLLGWIFLALGVISLVIGGVVIAKKSLGQVGDFKRISIAAGGGDVTLDGTGKWVGYYEASDVSSSMSRIPNFLAKVTGPSGTVVDLQRYGNRSDGKVDKFTYDYNGHKGIAAFQFTAGEKGTYRIQLEAVATLPSGAQVAIGRDIAGGTVAGGALIIVGVLLLVAAAVLLIVGFVKRSRHKKERQAAQFYGGPPPGYGQQPAFGAPYGAPAPGYGAPAPGFAPPPVYGGPGPQAQNQPPPGYQPPPPQYGSPAQPPRADEPPQPPYGSPAQPPRADEPPQHPEFGGPPPN